LILRIAAVFVIRSAFTTGTSQRQPSHAATGHAGNTNVSESEGPSYERIVLKKYLYAAKLRKLG
jgi:hypothetical protein